MQAALLATLVPEAHTQLAPNRVANHPASRETAIALDQLGTVAGKQHESDGLSVSATADRGRWERGRLACWFGRRARTFDFRLRCEFVCEERFGRKFSA